MNKKIMVVDDEPDVAFTVEFSLKDTDYDVIHVENGVKCLEMLRNKDMIPDLILLDIMMPKLSGWEVFKKLKENPSWANIPVIFLTARVDNTAENAGSFLGDDYIEKPYDPVDLKKRIEKVLNKK
jgi:putative two-component system response regulator